MLFVRKITFVLLGVLLISGCAKPENKPPLERGKDQFYNGQWDEAIGTLSQAVDQDPLNYEARLFRGRAYMCRGRENAPLAIADYNEAIRLNPEDYEAYYNRAIAYRQKGDRHRALADEMQARRLDPNAARSGAMQPPSLEEFREATGRGGEEHEDPVKLPTKTAADEPEDPTAPAIENLPIPTLRDNNSNNKSSASEITSKNPIPSINENTLSTPARDAYGLPIGSPRRVGSITDEILGLNKRNDLSQDFEERESLRSYDRRTSNRTARPNWQTHVPPSSAPLPPAPSLPPSKPSPIGTLPFGLPFQQPGYSPYAPNRPMTGRNSNLQGGYQEVVPRSVPNNSQFPPPSNYFDDRY